MKNAAWLRLGVVLCLGLGACEDEKDGSGLDGAKVVSELNDGEAKQLCEYVLGSLPRISNEQLCTLTGAALTDDEASCNAFHQSCIEEDATDVDGDCSNPKPKLVGCNTTIAELELCVDARNQAVEARAKSLSCADAPEVTYDTLTALPEECEEVVAACPQLIDD